MSQKHPEMLPSILVVRACAPSAMERMRWAAWAARKRKSRRAFAVVTLGCAVVALVVYVLSFVSIR
jgi:hypothetical protein